MEQQPEGADGEGDAPPASRLRGFVADALSAPTGPELLAGVLTVMGRDDLSARELVEVAVAWQRLIAYATAGQLTVAADLDRALPTAPCRGRGRVPAGRRAADELAPALGIAPATATRLVNLARRLDADLPAAADALAEGRMAPAQVRVLAEVTAAQPEHVTRQVEAEAVKQAPRQTPAQLREELAACAARVDPKSAARAAAAGRSERDAALRPSPLAGCSRLVLDLPTIEAHAAWHALNAAAVATKERGIRADGTAEDRTLPQLRADLATALLTGRADPRDASLVPSPERLAGLAEVQVVVGLATLTGGAAPGHVPGAGPVDARHVRELARRSGWRRLLADPATGTLRSAGRRVHRPPPDGEGGGGEPTSRGGGGGGPGAGPQRPRGGNGTGRASPADHLAGMLAQLLADPVEVPPAESRGYRPGRRLARHVRTRDATCIAPACHHGTPGTQLDHTRDHAAGGATAAGNLGSPCQRFHNAKTHGGWRLAQPAPGLFVWTSPTGRVYTRRARPLLPGWTPTRAGAAESAGQRPLD